MLKVDEAQVCLEQAQKHWQSQQWQATIQACAKALAIDQQLAQAHKLMGDALQKTDRIKEAIGYYQEAIDIKPDFAEVYANLGTLYARQQQWQQAIDNYQQALKIEPNFTAIYRHLIKCQLQQQTKTTSAPQSLPESDQILNNYLNRGQTLQQQGDLEASLEQYLNAAKLRPQLETYKEIVKLCEQLELWHQAAKYCRQILQLTNTANNSLVLKSTLELPQLPQAKKPAPITAENQFNLAGLSAKQKDWSRAISHYQQAIALEPKMAQAYLELARILTRLGDQERATQSWLQAIALEAEGISDREYLALGQTLANQGKHNSAITCYYRAIKQQPDLINAYLALGILLTKLGAKERAIACYLQGLKQQQHAELYFRLGNLYQDEQKWSQAVVCYQKATQHDAKHAAAYHELGEALSQQQLWSQAVTAYQQAIALNPNFSWSFNNLGYALIQLERWSEAVPIYQQAIALNPNFPWSYYNLAEACGKLGQWDQAIEYYQHSAQIQCDLPQLQQKLGDAFYRRSQQDRAIALKHFWQAIKQDPNDPEAYHQALAIDNRNLALYLKLGDILQQNGESDEALVIYQMALQIQPKNNEVLSRIQQCRVVPSSHHVSSADFQALAHELLEILPHSDTPEVSIIIPVYNQLGYTLKCLKAIALNLSNSTQVEVILVNDCSTDRTEEILASVSAVTLVNRQSNQGFIHSCNQGAAIAKGKYLYFLNNDTEIKPNCIESLMTVLAEDDQVGAVGSKLVYPQGSLQEAGGIVWQDASGWNYGRQDNPHAPEYNYLRPVDYCSGASLMVKKEVFDRLNGFEQDFAPAYYEDTDLCFAIRHQLGLKVMYQPKSEVIHYEGISSGTSTTSGTKKYQLVNAVKFKQKWQTALEQDNYLPNLGITNVPRSTRKYLGHKTILVIDSYMPSYDRESGSRRLFELLKIFKALNYHVIFAADNGVKAEPYTTVLQNLQIEVLYTQPGYGTKIEQQIAERLALIDLAWICRPELNQKYLPLMRQKPEIKVVYDTIDLHYLRLKRAWEIDPNQNTQAEWEQMQAQEFNLAHQADLTITVTPIEQKILQAQAVNNVAVIPNIHTPRSSNIPGFNQRSGILFIGSYNHPPNVDAVLWLCQEIMPLVWQTNPELKVTLLGNNPNADILALANNRIKVTGYIDDVSPYFLSHKLSVSPLRYGAGMKGKIGHSLEYGLPVVSTKIGTEGMNLIPQQHILEANNTVSFAQQIIRLDRDASLWNYLSSNAKQAIAPFSPEAVQQQINQIFQQFLIIEDNPEKSD